MMVTDVECERDARLVAGCKDLECGGRHLEVNCLLLD